ncbi:MAG: hypothetical protein EXS08_15695 [Planctomycetes bacterium]|nr:hypothetical protein [Planctomycetota bacterium]
MDPTNERGSALVPALTVAVFGLAVVFLRPPLPIDETRYLEVFRESLDGSALLLRLLGEPYAEKPPLLFWLARALATLGAPAEFALRCLPALTSALVVCFAARVGRRLGLASVAWLQAALLMPALASQFLIFDALLAACVWGAVDAWSARRDGRAWFWSSAALLAKGPVAFLFLVPYFWCTSELRGVERARRAAARILLLALLPLAAWALGAAYLGGPEFADALLWKRWAGRVLSSPDHARPRWFYAPVVLFGSLPASFVLLRRDAGQRPDWNRRLGFTVLGLLLVFTLISGKQAHYLVPLAPALALLAAAALERDPHALVWLRHGVRALLGILLAGLAVGAWILPGEVGGVSTRGSAWIESGAWKPLFAAAALVVAGALVLVGRARGPRSLCALTLGALGACMLVVHPAAGKLLYPHDLAAALRRAPEQPLAFLGSSQHGLYELLAGRGGLEKLRDREALEAWCLAHPEGLVVSEVEELHDSIPATLELVTRDVVHRSPLLVLRAARAATGAR